MTEKFESRKSEEGGVHHSFLFFFLDRESTLFVVLHLMNFTAWSHELTEFVKTTRGCLMEKLALIPTKKLIVEDFLEAGTNIPPETLALRFSWGIRKL